MDTSTKNIIECCQQYYSNIDVNKIRQVAWEENTRKIITNKPAKPQNRKTDRKISRGPFDGFLEAFYRPLYGCWIS